MELVFTYSPWWVLLFVFVALSFAMGLYYRDKQFNVLDKKFYNWLLFGLRFTSIFFLLFFLIEPLIKSINREVKKPKLVVAIDQSESMMATQDSTDLHVFFNDKWPGLVDRLSEKFEIETYGFGAQPTVGFDGKWYQKYTDLGGALLKTQRLFDNQNLAGTLVFSDGIVNRGAALDYLHNSIQQAVYVVGVGDTLEQKDVKISELRYNSLAYLGNKFPIEIDVAAVKCMGKEVVLTVHMNGENVYSTNIKIDSDHYFLTVPVSLEAKSLGSADIVVNVSALSEEISKVNNKERVFVEVLDARQKILLLSAAPHPDLGVLKRSIEQNKNYEVVSSNTFRGGEINYKDFDLVVVYGVRNIPEYTALLNEIQKAEKPVWMFTSSTTNPGRLPFNGWVQTGGRSSGTDRAQPILNKEFSLFTFTPEEQEILSQMPPLQSPFGDYTAVNNFNVFAYQRLGNINTERPLIMLGDVEGLKVGLTVGEGIWRWRLFEYSEFEQFDVFDRWVSQMIQYLALKEDKRKFKVWSVKNRYDESNEIKFNAELYNQSYELVNTPDVKMEITESEGNSYPFAFTRKGNAYVLNAGLLPPGKYRYTAQTQLGNEQHKVEGKFVILPQNQEFNDLTARHTELRYLAEQTKGAFYTLPQVEKLVADLMDDTTHKPVSYTTNLFKDLIHWKWIFFALVALLGTEWFLRRWSGGY